MRLLGGYVAVMGALTVVCVAVTCLAGPRWQYVLLAALALGAAAAVAAGVAVRRPARPLPWLLLATASLCLAASEVCLFTPLPLMRTTPSPYLWDAFALPKYPLVAAGLGLFARARSSGRDRGGLIDAATVTAGLAMLLWLFRMVPALFDPGHTWQLTLVTMLYPVGQIAFLLELAWLLAPGLTGGWPTRLLIGGTACGLTSNVVFGMLRANVQDYAGWQLSDLGWLACFALCGAAALHPGMRELTEPAPRRSDETSRVRLAVLMISSLVAPLLIIFHGDGSPRHTAIAISAVVLYLLALARLWAVNASYLHALTWERALRRAGPTLASARSVEEIAAAIRHAADTVSGPRPARAALLATRADGTLRVVTTPADEQPGPSGPSAEPAPAWLPPLLPRLAGGRPPVLVTPAELAAAGGTRHGDDWVLLCPLTAGSYWPGDPLVGVLALSGPGRWLRARRASLEILANEVGLALERVLLSVELVRRQGLLVFQTLVQDASDAILIIEDDGTVRYATPSATAIFGDIPLVGAQAQGLADSIERDWHPDGPFPGDKGRAAFSELWRIERRDGRAVHAWVRYSDLRADPTVNGVVLTLRDVTEQQRLRQEMQHRAFHDALTGLPNRLLFADRAAHALTLARRSGTTTAVLLLDVDDFKEVNDTMGHAVGDELLAAFGQRLAQVARESDTAARIGGDEFALLVENFADPAEIDTVADRVLAAFADTFPLSEGPVLMSTTIGVATSRDSGTVDELMRHADLALYAAKAAGKRRWEHYAPALSTGMHRRREIRSALEKAVGDSAFALAYQPIVALDTGLAAGFEALIRWPHPEQGLLMPGQFIEIAEDTGLIVPLGLWVLRQALRDLAEGHGAGAGAGAGSALGPPYVSVNVSARQFRSAGFLASVRQALESAGLPPSALLLELTESVLLRSDGSIGTDLAELKRLGVRLAIDDFGTGYSSLSYLRELPIDVLKIDRSFVDGIAASPQRLALAKGIVDIAKTLGIAVVAEGIETAEQCALLAAMGCEYGQCYLLAMPMEWPDARALLSAQRVLIPGQRPPSHRPGDRARG